MTLHAGDWCAELGFTAKFLAGLRNPVWWVAKFTVPQEDSSGAGDGKMFRQGQLASERGTGAVGQARCHISPW